MIFSFVIHIRYIFKNSNYTFKKNHAMHQKATSLYSVSRCILQALQKLVVWSSWLKWHPQLNSLLHFRKNNIKFILYGRLSSSWEASLQSPVITASRTPLDTKLIYIVIHLIIIFFKSDFSSTCFNWIKFLMSNAWHICNKHSKWSRVC